MGDEAQPVTIKVHVIAEPSSIAQEAELVILSRPSDGVFVCDRVVPLPPGRLVSEYIHQGQSLIVREKPTQ